MRFCSREGGSAPALRSSSICARVGNAGRPILSQAGSGEPWSLSTMVTRAGRLVLKPLRCSGRFGNAALGEQTEAAIKRRLHHALLFKNIGEGPVTHHFREAVALANGVGHPRSHESCVRDGGLVHVAGVEFAPNERSVRVGRSGDLVVNFFDRAANHAGAGNIFVRAEDVFGFVVAVDVG